MLSFSSVVRFSVVGALILACSSATANPFSLGVSQQKSASQKEISLLREEIKAIRSDVGSLKRKSFDRPDVSDLIPMQRVGIDGLNGDSEMPPEAPSTANLFYFDPLNPTSIPEDMIPSSYLPFMEVNGRYLLKNTASGSGAQYLTVSQKAYYERLMPVDGTTQSPAGPDDEQTGGEE